MTTPPADAGAKLKKPLPVGSVFYWHGQRARIAAVGFAGGERYYWLQLKDGSIAMVPATEVEDGD